MAAVSAATGDDLYLKLIQRFSLRPIRSDEELARAIQVIDSLLDRDNMDSAEEDYLEVLSELVKRYETEEHPIQPVSDAELLRHLLEAKGVSQTEVARYTMIAASTISEVLSEKRKFNRIHIGRLAHYFGIEPGAFSF